MNADGSAETRITNNEARTTISLRGHPTVRSFAWFASNRTGDFEVWTMNVDGSNPIRLTTSPLRAGDPAWSPDGTKIAYNRFEFDAGGWDIYVMNADGANPTRYTNLAGTDSSPDWAQLTGTVQERRMAAQRRRHGHAVQEPG